MNHRTPALAWACALLVGCGGNVNSPPISDASPGGGSSAGTAGAGGGNGGGSAGSGVAGGGAAGAAGSGGSAGAGGEIVTPIVISSQEDSPVDLAVDDTAVYWIDQGLSTGAASIRSKPKSGGAVTTVSSSPANPTQLALDGTYVYWISLGPTQTPASTIQRVAKTGGVVEPIVMQANQPTGLVVQEGALWWANNPTCGTGTIMRDPFPTVDMESFPYANNDCIPRSFASSGSRVYWTTQSPGVTLRSIATSGGSTTDEATDRPGEVGEDIVAVGNVIYWTSVSTDGSSGGVFSMRTDVPDQPEWLDTTQANPGDVAADANHVFWIADNPHGVWYLPIPVAGAPSRLLAADPGAQRVVSDGSSVYWTSVQGDAGSILALQVP